MGDEMLASVCELAFDVAKEGGAPSAMKNYLYLAQRPPRAYSVAQRALEEDANFRARVVDRATIENVGEAGYLWLHRPTGWEQRFSALNAGVAPIGGVPSADTPLAQRPPMPAVPSVDQTPVVSQPTPATQVPAEPIVNVPPSPEPPRHSTSASTVSSIEDELSSLRGLVDRLADERQNVRSSVTELEVELETRRAENVEMFTKLSALRNELTTVQSSESTILLDRDRALARVAELEADVARLTVEVERMAAEAEGSSSEHEAALTDLAIVASERDGLRREVATIKAEHATSLTELETLRSELGDLTSKRASLQGELDAVTTDRNSLTGQFNDTLAERDQLQAKLDTTNAELGELRSQLATVEGERSDMAERIAAMDSVSADNTELASRLSVAEQARVDLEQQLEDVSEKWKTATRQLSVFENVNGQLDGVASERDALREQLSLANSALTELQGRIGTSHEQIRSELTSIESTFGSHVEALSVATPATDTSVVPDPVASTPSTGSTDTDSAPEISTDDVDAPAANAPALGDPEIETPAFVVPAVDGVDDLDAPSFGEGVDFGVQDAAPLGSEALVDDDDAEATDEEDVFDGKGIEMDPTTLGGRTIGDMFGGGDERTTDGNLTIGDADEAMNGNASPDASGLDDLIHAAADEPTLDAPSTDDIPAFDAPLVEDLPAFDAPAVEDIPTMQDASAIDQRATPADLPDAAAGRRRLSIPAGLDEASSARHVVSFPDVILLIDGDGAAGLGWPHLDVATRRSALVDYLGTLTAETGAAADVVFARPVGDEDALPVSRAVRVRIADAAVAESPIFSSIVAGYPEEWPIAIITNEPVLLAQADGLEAVTLSNDQLLDLFLDLNSGS